MSIATAAAAAGVQDLAVLSQRIELVGAVKAVDLTNAVTGDPQLDRTIDGATEFSLEVIDYSRALTRSGIFSTADAAVVDGVHLELVGAKLGDIVTLTFEDAVIGALRRRTSPLTFDADTLTRQQAAQRLAAEAGVRIVCDPTDRGRMAKALERSGGTDGTTKAGKTAAKTDSWTLLGQLATDFGGRCFSDGTRLLFGSDDWLLSRVAPLRVAEGAGGVQAIQVDLDIAADTATATVTVDTDAWSIPPGQPVEVTGMGPGDGLWLVEAFHRPLLRTRGTLDLVRRQPPLTEAAIDAASGDQGEEDFLPDAMPLDDGPTPVSARALEQAGGTGLGKMLTYALGASGHRYVWGTSGPNTYDCSGLVQQATAAGGRKLAKPASAQLAACQRGAAQMLTVDAALATRGALLFRVGYAGEGNHVAISLGDGTTIEARGAKYGCGVFPNAARRKWNAGALVNFTGATAAPTRGGPR